MKKFVPLIAALLLFGCLTPQPAPSPTPSASPQQSCVFTGDSCCIGAKCSEVIVDCTQGFVPEIKGCTQDCKVMTECVSKPTPSPVATLPASANPSVTMNAPSAADFSSSYDIAVSLAFDASPSVLPSARLRLYDNGELLKEKEVPSGANSTFKWIAAHSGNRTLDVTADFLLADGSVARTASVETNVSVAASELSDYAHHSSVLMSDQYVDAQRFALSNPSFVENISVFVKAPTDVSTFMWLRLYVEEQGRPGALLFERLVNTTELPRDFGWYSFNISRILEKGGFWAGMYVRDSPANVSWAMYDGTMQSAYTISNVQEWVPTNGTFFVRVS
ncbi:Uncharacterised protein [Candidatus Norongarragalina meridionalis]|nr:Uncharacterised protein [Candidatus Norongarragalina meridionalis]